MTSDLNKENNTVRIIRHVTMVGFWINAFLVIIKLFFGYWGDSDALVADGYHSISDFVTDLIVIVFAGKAYKKADKDHPYGHGKYETFASFVIGLILFLVALFLLYEGVQRVIEACRGLVLPRPDVWTIIVAIVSIGAKEWCYRYTYKKGEKIDSSSLKANAAHHRSDAISSIATLIGVSIAFALGAKWRICDPIASIVISLLIGISAYKTIKPAFDELLEISLPESMMNKIEVLVSRVPGVKNVHNLRTRRNGHSIIVEMNVHVDPDIKVSEAHHIASEAEKVLMDNLGKNAIIYIHVEPEE
ncbi:MAG: cation diffusion facilitator family transporter [Muribaculaceae bacterium]|nr:cation diffusion facilitator family transporter [Muribaculaceae bacterium]